MNYFQKKYKLLKLRFKLCSKRRKLNDSLCIWNMCPTNNFFIETAHKLMDDVDDIKREINKLKQ